MLDAMQMASGEGARCVQRRWAPDGVRLHCSLDYRHKLGSGLSCPQGKAAVSPSFGPRPPPPLPARPGRAVMTEEMGVPVQVPS